MLKKTKNQIKNQNKGITLIALVITVIVLLILAGIGISMLSGDNNILKRAGDAKDKTELESLAEEAKIVMSNRTIEKTTMGTNSKTLKQDLESGISGGQAEEITKADGTTKYTDVCYVTKNGKTITVYEDGEIEEGKVSIWKGVTDIECPEFKKDENNVWNWYIYTAGQLKFLADFVNNGNSLNGTENGADLNDYVTQANYDPSTVTMSTDTTIYLMNNLDLGARHGEGTTEEEKWATNPDELKWTPIGIDQNNVKDKLGTFEGNNYTICGVYVNRDTPFSGIFGNSNTIQNLTIKNSYIKASYMVGGIVGRIRSGKIGNCHNINTLVISTDEELSAVGGVVGQASKSNYIIKCTNSGKVIGNGVTYGGYVGGIIGFANVSVEIIECNNNGTIKGKEYVGGIVGCSDTSSTISECNNNGAIEGKNYVGGIVGCSKTSSTIIECNNNVAIEGNRCVGGIVGSSFGTIRGCKNSGTIEGESERVGGIAGNMTYNSKVEQCSNIGNVTGKGEYNGGIVGIIPTDTQDPSDKDPATVSKCYNSGKVQGKDYTGGVIGTAAQYKSLIEKSYNLGEVNGTGNVGGIAGSFGRSSRLVNCYNINKVTGTNNVGGIAGNSYSSTCEIKNCYNIGNVSSGTTNLGGILGKNQNSSTIENSYYLEGTAALDVGSGSTNSLAKNKEFITQDFVTTANTTETIWKVEAGKNDGWPILNE